MGAYETSESRWWSRIPIPGMFAVMFAIGAAYNIVAEEWVELIAGAVVSAALVAVQIGIWRGMRDHGRLLRFLREHTQEIAGGGASLDGCSITPRQRLRAAAGSLVLTGHVRARLVGHSARADLDDPGAGDKPARGHGHRRRRASRNDRRIWYGSRRRLRVMVRCAGCLGRSGRTRSPIGSASGARRTARSPCKGWRRCRPRDQSAGWLASQPPFDAGPASSGHQSSSSPTPSRSRSSTSSGTVREARRGAPAPSTAVSPTPSAGP